MGKGHAGVRGMARVGGSSWPLLLLGILLIMTLGAVPPGLSGVAPGMPEALNIPADGIQAGAERAAGELPGRWAVTPAGGFTYALPLDIPAGRVGMQPSLALTYASGGGNGHLGVGWSLAGLSTISRCTRNLAEDGLSDGVDFDADDRFCLDGMKLVPSSSSDEPSYGHNLIEYRTEADSHVKVISYGTDARGPWRFKAYLPGGIERTYEAHNVARREGRLPGNLPGPEDDGGLVVVESQVRLVWLLKAERDLHGNTVEYRYGSSDDGSEWWPERIDYTGHEDGTPALRSVRFVYAPENQPRLDQEVSWLSGVVTLMSRRLAAIEMHAPSPATTELVWRYNLAYAPPDASSTGRSLLRSVQKCGALGTCLRKKEFTYSAYGNNAGGGSLPYFQTTEVAAATLPPQAPGDAFSIDQPVIHVLDANGDGADDLLFQLGEAKVRYLRSKRTEDGVVLALAEQSEILGDASHDMLWLARSMPVDIDDDGRAELFGVRWPLAPGDRNFSVYQVDPTRFVTKQADVVVPLAYNDGSIEQAAAHYFIDTDGDGQVELIRRSFTEVFNNDPQDPGWSIGETELEIWHNDGGVLVGPTSLGGFAEHSRCTGNVVDLDGDGRGEVVMPRSGDDNECSATTAIALGRDGSGALVLTNSRAAPEEGHRFIGRTALHGDVNGDGLVDRIEGGSVAINTGNGFFYPGTFSHQGQVVADINNDGKADLLEFETGQSPTIKAWASNGFTLVEHDLGLIPGDPAGGEDTYSRVGDFTGDGKVDIVVFTGGKVLLHEQVSPSKPDLLMQVSDEGAGWPDVEVTYSDRWWEGRHGPMPSCDYPLHCVKRGLTVVREVALRDHLVDPVNVNAGVRTLYYSYDDPVSDDGGRGFLGFGTFRVWDPSRPQETVIRYGHRRDSGFMGGGTFLHGGRPKSIRVATPILDSGAVGDRAQGADTRVVLTELAYGTWLGDGGVYQLLMQPYAAAFQTYQIVPTGSTVKEWEQQAAIDWGDGHNEHILGIQEPSTPLRRSVSTIDDFDAELGVARRTTASVDGGSTVVTEIEYDRLFDQRYLMALPRSVTTTVTDAEGRQASRQVELSHSLVNGLIERTTVGAGLGDAYEQRTSYDYHPTYGVLIGTVREAAGAGNRREQRLEYGPLVAGAPDEFIYPSQVWAPRAGGAAQPSRWFAVHPGHGVLLAAMDANGVQAEKKHDDLGRVLYRKTDGGAAVSYSYQARVEASGATNGLLIDTTIGAASARVSIGGAGQTLATWKKGFDGSTIVQTYEHDALGRTRRVSRPSDSGAPVAFTTVTLDSLDRLLEVLHPDGTTSRQEHTFFTTRSFDALDNESYVIRDVHGRVATSAQVIDGAGVATEYGYGPDGAVETVTDAHGNVTQYEVDALGRRVWQLEPDAGETELVYNGLGELVRRTRSGSVGGTVEEEESYRYDDLGRLVEKESPDGLTRFTWDTATHGIGKLHAAQSPDGFAAVYSYDSNGRGARVTYEHEGSTYAFDMAYNGLGQLEKVYYPEVPGRQRFAAKYAYNGLGYLSEVGDATGGGYTRLWRVDARNADGQLQQGVFGPNNVVTLTRTYDALTGRVDRIRALGFGGSLLDLDYDYKANGLVQRRSDLVSQREEIFDYDEAGRIIYWALTQSGGTTPTAYRYDDLGNLTEVWKKGALAERNTYGNPDGSLPHALTGRDLPVVNQHDVYAYDALGRNTTGGGRTGAAYTMFDLPRGLDRGADNWTFAYDAFGGRVKREGPGGTIVYIDDLYEKRSTAGGGTKHVFHVEGSDGKVAQVVYDEATGVEVMEYQVHDALGSTGVVFGSNGTLIERMFNEPFGGRIEADGTSFVGAPKNTLDGFTGHEMEPELGLINMRGRMYDPVIRRFLTPDPVVTNPLNGQDWNAYSYVRNSPLNRVDPSGYTHCTTGLAGEPADYNGACGSGASGGGGSGGGTAGGTGAAAVGAGQGFRGGDGNPGTDSTGGGGRGVGLGKGDQRPKGGNFVGGASGNADDGGSAAGGGLPFTLDWPFTPAPPPYTMVQLVPELTLDPPRAPFTPFFRERPPPDVEEAEWEYDTFLIDLRLRTERDIARWEAEDRPSLFADPAWRAQVAEGLWVPIYWRWKADQLQFGFELILGEGLGLVGGAILGAAFRGTVRAAPRAYSVAFETTIPKLGIGKNRVHFAAANRELLKAAAADAELASALRGTLGPHFEASILTPGGRVLGTSPAGWTWHHVVDRPGVLQLVPRLQHQSRPFAPLFHPNGVGGMKLWGALY